MYVGSGAPVPTRSTPLKFHPNSGEICKEEGDKATGPAPFIIKTDKPIAYDHSGQWVPATLADLEEATKGGKAADLTCWDVPSTQPVLALGTYIAVMVPTGRGFDIRGCKLLPVEFLQLSKGFNSWPVTDRQIVRVDDQYILQESGRTS